LENGDRLTRAEFERRYDAMPNLKKAELIVEVTASSASYDLNAKMESYRRNGVQEYVVWRIYDRQVDWFRLEEGRYVVLPPDSEGVIHSRLFPGLCLDAPALLAGDLARVLACSQRRLSSPEHAAFGATLRCTGSIAEPTK
jgi:Uma2 family endonuclease